MVGDDLKRAKHGVNRKKMVGGVFMVFFSGMALEAMAWSAPFAEFQRPGWVAKRAKHDVNRKKKDSVVDGSRSSRVIDGDTLEWHGQRIRLYGIDAPEMHQQCRDGADRPYPCGQRSKLALKAMINGRPVDCEARDRDPYGRTVAVCRVGGEEINRWMVRAGWAVAYRQYSHDYIPDEIAAKTVRQGLWVGTFQMPWEWRRDHPR